MTKDLRQRRAGQRVRRHGRDDRAGDEFVQVRPAYPAQERCDQDVVVGELRLGRRDVLDPDVFLAVEPDCAHGSVLSY